MSRSLLTLAEAAELAGVNPASLRHAIRRGTLTATLYGKTYLVTRDEIARFIRERRFADKREGLPVYWLNAMPNHTVIDHDDVLWLVPIIPGGWDKRVPYRGHREALREYTPAASSRLIAATVGYPAVSAPTRRAGE